MTVITRFAPSPTGSLHIGSARTAYFNWLYARRFGGRYLVRIEDTDTERSTADAISTIKEGLSWLGIEGDEPPLLQSSRQKEHVALAHLLVDKGCAYLCYASPQELAAMREQARKQGKPARYNGLWRDKDPKDAPANIKPTIRLKAPQTGTTTLHDLIQGKVTVHNEQLDDMILLRSDGTPTYMLSVVADDRHMGVTHIIRGDDHLTNSFRQYQLYEALGWQTPHYAHMPLLHGSDGKKLSKRHGALSVGEWHQQGYLAEAMLSYLVRLGWSHKDDEIIPREQACLLFDVKDVGKAAARFDKAKLDYINAHFMRSLPPVALYDAVCPFFATPPRNHEKERIIAGLDSLKKRARTLSELADNAKCYRDRTTLSPQARDVLQKTGDDIRQKITYIITNAQEWDRVSLEQSLRHYAEDNNIPMKQLAQPLRAALSGDVVSPPLFEMMALLGASTCRKRWTTALKT
ncbi:MAG: glutamate--tRNA ligase [Alphaproteobacteria bacterium GM202ARS2]|nr:glutamate--tRNA ligase [Alphaproteobacteria bacterium GM202ARS2]